MITCGTAPGKVFADEQAYKAHLRTDWHRYNLRRKVAGMSMVSEEEYNTKVESQRLASTQGNTEKQDSHVKPSKRDQHRAKKKAGQGYARAGAVTWDSVAAYRQQRTQEETQTVDAEGDPMEEEEDDDGEIVTAEARAIDSWFDAKHFNDCTSALEYMRKQYGLYIPEPTYLIDVEKLAQYLCEKVKQHRVCLYCSRQFRFFRACQQHMIDKSHCKIAYETDEALEELADFYDFSSSYDQYETEDLQDVGINDEDDDDDDDDDDFVQA
mmetsp:Transcript_15052/g.18569  ORF Transcript_15052/g.18569 Transcript_15052/m.18569 type:complete len:268 (+) Transcript_15052:71-874(+)